MQTILTVELPAAIFNVIAVLTFAVLASDDFDPSPKVVPATTQLAEAELAVAALIASIVNNVADVFALNIWISLRF